MSQEAQAKYLLRAFIGWDVRIRDAFMTEFKRLMEEDGRPLPVNVYYKPCTEYPSPPFVDVATAMMWDQFDVVRGDLVPEVAAEYRDDPFRQASIDAIRALVL